MPANADIPGSLIVLADKGRPAGPPRQAPPLPLVPDVLTVRNASSKSLEERKWALGTAERRGDDPSPEPLALDPDVIAVGSELDPHAGDASGLISIHSPKPHSWHMARRAMNHLLPDIITRGMAPRQISRAGCRSWHSRLACAGAGADRVRAG